MLTAGKRDAMPDSALRSKARAIQSWVKGNPLQLAAFPPRSGAPPLALGAAVLAPLLTCQSLEPITSFPFPNGNVKAPPREWAPDSLRIPAAVAVDPLPEQVAPPPSRISLSNPNHIRPTSREGGGGGRACAITSAISPSPIRV